MDLGVSVASLGVAVLAMARLFTRGGSRNVLLAVVAFFVLFAYGPVVNLLAGRSIYSGTALERLDLAVTGFALALVGILAADAVLPQRGHFDEPVAAPVQRRYGAVALVFAALIGYGLFIMAAHYPDLLSGHKLLQLRAAGPGHRIYLLMQLSAVSLFFLTRQRRTLRWLWIINLAVYLSYSLLTSERDFLLVLFAILVHRDMLANKTRTIRLVVLGAMGVVGGAALFAMRASQKLDVTGVLNQGSILFVDTFVMRQVPERAPHLWGQTYWDTLVGILPTWVLDVGVTPLNQWFVSIYAPASRSGYGFSLTGEAYLNFGLAGIPAVFFVLTLAHRAVVNRADRSEWWCYLSVYSTTVWMYALRGDSAQLVKSLLYGAAFFAVCSLLSRRAPGAPEGRVAGGHGPRTPVNAGVSPS